MGLPSSHRECLPCRHGVTFLWNNSSESSRRLTGPVSSPQYRQSDDLRLPRHRGALAGALGSPRDVPRAESRRPPLRSRRAQVLRAGHVPVSVGVGLHVGHPLGYIGTDIVARYKRMRGCNVLHPMGFDAFGLPAEQFAVEHGVHPRITTEQNIATMVRQLKRLGLSYDWRRCLATTDPGYYRWTQWIFLRLYESYFDPDEQKARPIEALVRRLEAGELMVGVRNELVSVAGSGAMSVLGGAPPRDAPLVRAEPDRAARGTGRAPAGLPGRGARELVPGTGDGAGQRGSDERRPQRPRKSPGLSAPAPPVDAAHHGLRRAIGRRARARRLAGVHQGDAA